MNGKSQLFVRALPRLLAVSALVGLAFLAACNGNAPKTDQEMREQAAQATETAKQDSKEALAQARVAAQNAERAVNDVTAGVKDGLHSNNAPSGETRIDLNTASADDLASLAGISPSKAKEIIRHRPYSFSHELVKFGLLSERQFDVIAPKITVR